MQAVFAAKQQADAVIHIDQSHTATLLSLMSHR